MHGTGNRTQVLFIEEYILGFSYRREFRSLLEKKLKGEGDLKGDLKILPS